MAAGVAAPLVHIPFAGTISYLWHPGYLPGGFTEGAAAILSAAALSIILAVLSRLKLLWLTGTVALAQLIGTLVVFHHNAAKVVAQADTPELVDPMVMWAGAALDRAHFQWGIGVIATGAVMILAAAVWNHLQAPRGKPKAGRERTQAES